MQDKEVFQQHFMRFIPTQVKTKLKLNAEKISTPKKIVQDIIKTFESEKKVTVEKPDKFRRRIHYSH